MSERTLETRGPAQESNREHHKSSYPGQWTAPLALRTEPFWTVGRTASGLAAGSHTLKVVVLGTERAAARGSRVVVDGFRVGNSTVASPALRMTWPTARTSKAMGGGFAQSDSRGATTTFRVRQARRQGAHRSSRDGGTASLGCAGQPRRGRRVAGVVARLRLLRSAVGRCLWCRSCRGGWSRSWSGWRGRTSVASGRGSWRCGAGGTTGRG